MIRYMGEVRQLSSIVGFFWHGVSTSSSSPYDGCAAMGVSSAFYSFIFLK